MFVMMKSDSVFVVVCSKGEFLCSNLAKIHFILVIDKCSCNFVIFDSSY